MRVTVVAIGTRMPAWVDTGVAEYQKRLSGVLRLEIAEIAALRRTKNSDLERIKQQEGELLWQAVPRNAMAVAMDAAGKQMDTGAFSKLVDGWIDDAQDVALLIGGPEGLSSDVLQRCPMKLSLSRLTFAHPLVRLVIAEQLYRAYSIRQGSPYHR